MSEHTCTKCGALLVASRGNMPDVEPSTLRLIGPTQDDDAFLYTIEMGGRALFGIIVTTGKGPRVLSWNERGEYVEWYPAEGMRA